MLKQIFAVYDQKTKVFGQPFYAVNQASAVRDFTYAANDKTTDIYRYATDIGLFFMGTFDDTAGKLEGLDQPEHILSAFQVQNIED